MQAPEIAIFWFRRDLRLEDNAGLSAALNSGLPVIPIFIFDTEIIENLERNDPRVSFIYSCLKDMNRKLVDFDSSLLVKKGKPLEIWKALLQKYTISKVYFNKDYEPYAIQRDQEIIDVLLSKEISAYAFKDQVIFEKSEVTKDDGNPYTVYTPYKKKVVKLFQESRL